MISRRRFLQLGGMTAVGFMIPERLEGIPLPDSYW